MTTQKNIKASELRVGDSVLHMGTFEVIRSAMVDGTIVDVVFEGGRDVYLVSDADVTIEARKNPRAFWNGTMIGRFLGCENGLALIDCPEAEDMDTRLPLAKVQIEGLTHAQALAYVPGAG